ncbi:uncharacterized protein [Nicotiana sylvestris]|uniref:uncharacterized protein n=1 Tax=Nicotiana sylvestris TaxID=4096 RepID=UPI00388CB02A
MLDSTDAPPAQTSTGNGINRDLNHPFFLYSSDAPGMNLVNAVCDGKGFQGWKRSILIALSAKNKAGFINGTIAPPPITFKDYQPWSRLKRLWDELDSLNSNVKYTCTCICDGKKILEKSQEDERLIQFLMGLNEAYGQARRNILIMNPLPNINHAYSLVLQDENQREVYNNPLISTDTSSFMVENQAKFH